MGNGDYENRFCGWFIAVDDSIGAGNDFPVGEMRKLGHGAPGFGEKLQPPCSGNQALNLHTGIKRGVNGNKIENNSRSAAAFSDKITLTIYGRACQRVRHGKGFCRF